MQKLDYSAVGTIIKSGKNLPIFDSALKKYEVDFRISNSGILAAKWLDSKELIVLSNCYNEIMEGVHPADQKISAYDLDRRSAKW